jgi:hypothetical protein
MRFFWTEDKLIRQGTHTRVPYLFSFTYIIIAPNHMVIHSHVCTLQFWAIRNLLYPPSRKSSFSYFSHCIMWWNAPNEVIIMSFSGEVRWTLFRT